MPFFLKLKNNSFTHIWTINEGKKPDLSWTNHPDNLITLPESYKQEIEYFQADGDELGYIMLRFRNLPITHGGSCKWRGELAQFIYDNL